jgi:hypothetical protein
MSEAISTKRVDEGGRLVLRLAGHLDADSARDILEQVAGVHEGPVLLEFFNVASIDARALTSLAEGLRAHPAVSLRGLGNHQLRLLAYLGVNAARPSADGRPTH